MRRGFEGISRIAFSAFRNAGCVSALALFACLAVGSTANAADDAYRSQGDTYSGQSGVDTYRSTPPPSETYRPAPPDNYQSSPPARSGGGAYAPDGDSRAARDSDQGGGYGAPYAPPSASRGDGYPPPGDGPPPEHESYSQDEIVRAGNNFFGKVSGGLASAVEWAFQNAGRPNGYILGQDAGGAFVAGLSYGEGRLFTKDAGTYKVYWQGPSVGYDFGGDGSKVMTLVYNLRDPSDIYDRFGGVEGTAYLVGGVSVQIQKAGHVTLAPIRAGVGLRLGANIGYLKYTRSPTWNPF
ncbi:DUF1134 domain-containing protein [Hyphomicrobium sp.]|jgi:hypothetical protein|uniref:DUF1134 domain-containing protein n=1 Tax=Hyphomicrobium sp. TaxID=82 RepID=UPI00356B4E79